MKKIDPERQASRLEQIRYTGAWMAIRDHYGDRTAERSGVPLMRHIEEGVAILAELGADLGTMEAYCYHPLMQNDADLLANREALTVQGRLGLYPMRPWVVILVMEYRSQANAWLSDKVHLLHRGDSRQTAVPTGRPTPGPLPEVRLMLIADKVQNYKDFLLHHHGRHARSAELAFYFQKWLEALGIDQAEFTHLARIAESA
jgi:hypothetical protein